MKRNLFLGVTWLLLSPTFVFGASVQKCSREKRTCVINLEEGEVGDRVSVLNERRQIVAVGWIVNKFQDEGSVSRLAEIRFKEIFRDVRRNYPVIVDLENRGSERKLAPRI